MKYTIIIYLILITPVTIAEELVFPSTANEIVKALKPSSTIQKKGLAAIASDIPSPRVGAIIHFDFDSATIKPKSYSLLREYAIALKGGLASERIEIIGHTDSIGTEVYNLNLSKRRAQAVKDFLVFSHSIAANRLKIKGFGEFKPLVPNTTKAGMAKNRRVEFVVLR